MGSQCECCEGSYDGPTTINTQRNRNLSSTKSISSESEAKIKVVRRSLFQKLEHSASQGEPQIIEAKDESKIIAEKQQTAIVQNEIIETNSASSNSIKSKDELTNTYRTPAVFRSIDNALAAYYAQHNVHYQRDEMHNGKFLQYMCKNEYDAKNIKHELGDNINIEECKYIMFDYDHFPLKKNINQEEKDIEIFRVIQHCFKYGDPPKADDTKSQFTETSTLRNDTSYDRIESAQSTPHMRPFIVDNNSLNSQAADILGFDRINEETSKERKSDDLWY